MIRPSFRWLFPPLVAALLLLSGRSGIVPRIEPQCTAFCLCSGDSVVVGKNLDWPIGDGILVFNGRGRRRVAAVDSTSEALPWVSEFGSITFNQLGAGMPLGGMNEQGLVVEELSYWPSRYPTAEGRPVVNELQWIQLQLDTKSTVREVMAHLSDAPVARLLFGLHYFVADRTGEAAVIEFLDGKAVVTSGSALAVPVLTNDTYENSLRYLRRHRGFGGLREETRGDESPERFVRAARGLKGFLDAASDRRQGAVHYAFRILSDTRQRDTQWSIVYDPVHLEVHYRTATSPAIRTVQLHADSLECGEHPSFTMLDAERTASRMRLTPDVNSDLVDGIFARMLAELAAGTSVLSAARGRLETGDLFGSCTSDPG